MLALVLAACSPAPAATATTTTVAVRLRDDQVTESFAEFSGRNPDVTLALDVVPFEDHFPTLSATLPHGGHAGLRPRGRRAPRLQRPGGTCRT